MSKTQKQQNVRSPVIVVMGHVDHGKTALLDHIRKTNVVAKEAGGITQSIGAYEIIHNEKRITFIDTPGHEAFSSMRARGAKVADLAILVVAADEGVKQQTIEAANHIKDSEVPFVVAINKIDRPNADVNRTKAQLSENEIFLEGMGGDISYQEVSAKTGEGINELLDLVLLAVEVADLTYDPKTDGRGVVIEAHMDPQRGNTVTAVVGDGVVREGDVIATPMAEGRIRIMEDFLGNRIDSAHPSTPIRIVGFEQLPAVGEEFVVGGKATKRDAGAVSGSSLEKDKDERVTLNIIVRGDVAGSAEALTQLLQSLENEYAAIRIVDSGVGDITDNDVNLAIAANALIAGFNVKPLRSAVQFAKNNRIPIMTSSIIYEIVQAVEKEMKKRIPKPPSGVLKVLEVFRKLDNRQVIGGEVQEGYMKNGAEIAIVRGGEKIGEGKIVNLQHNKQDADTVEAGKECGILFEGTKDVRKGDALHYFEE